MSGPVLYSFRRCPYAMRARLAVASAGINVELREIVLRDKAPEFLDASPKGTVPVLITKDDQVIEESRDIIDWALAQNDPEGWRDGPPDQTKAILDDFDGPFKSALDRYKYANRYDGVDPIEARTNAAAYLAGIESRLAASPWLFGAAPRLADMAILPFVRQFAFVDKPWFDGCEWPGVHRWLEAFLASDRFQAIMSKYPKWQNGDPATYFP